MVNKPSKCDEAKLHTLLEADETSLEFDVALQHVEMCEPCRQRLEQLAASREIWQESHAALGGDHWDSQLLSSASETSWHRLQQPSSTVKWSESMIRQLLGPASHPELLGRLGRYEVERLIGSGGMGVVFKAYDTELHRPVAIKVLAPHLSGNGAARQRFAREARAAAAVVHEHIVAIHNVESNELSPYLVMQYVAGESLQQRIDRIGPLQLCEVLRIGMQTAAGLAAAHAQGLVHRDIKPANILLEQGVERALLTDFGLARASDDASLTHTGYHLGTPQYMSPEQASGDSIDARSDLFSLGSVIYAMCTGHPPFRAETTLGVLRRISDHQPRALREMNSQVPIWLERVVDMLLAKSPADRFQTADEVWKMLEQCLAHIQQPTVAAIPESLLDNRSRAAKRSRYTDVTRWLVIVSLLACVVVAIVVSRIKDAMPNKEPTPTVGSEIQWDWGAAESEKVFEDISNLEADSRVWGSLIDTSTTRERGGGRIEPLRRDSGGGSLPK